MYHLHKFARRHKGLVGGVIATGVALVLGLVGTILFAIGEAHQRGQAEHNAQQAIVAQRDALFQAQQAIDANREAQFQAYRARMAAAAAALSAHDVADAARQLDAAPEDLRGWEWRHLSSRLDDSSEVIRLPAGASRLSVRAPRTGFPSLGQLLPSTGLRGTDLDGGEHRVPADRCRESTGIT